MPRLLLINPLSHTLGLARWFQLPPIALLQVGAAVPPGWEVVLVDETLDAVPDGDGFDAAGITAMTYQAPRAYAIADRLRRRGTPVILGGIHPTVLPEEAKLHADAVVVGEAEPVMAQLLGDLERGALRPFYRHDPEGEHTINIPPPRWDLIEGKRYLTRQIVHFTRGCPYDCPFCTVTRSFGRRFRHRPLQDVLEEIDGFRKGFILLLDDDVLADPAYSRDLLGHLAGRGKRWIGQVTLKSLMDKEWLALVARSGCVGVLIGLESVPGPQGGDFRKNGDVHDMAAAVARIQDAGIMVEGSFIFGFDWDDEGVFDRTVDFVDRTAMTVGSFHLLTPYPGTATARQLEAEGRILHRDWSRYFHSDVAFRPKHMSPERLYRGWVEARQAVASMKSIFSRFANNPHPRLSGLAYNLLRKSTTDRLSPQWRGPGMGEA
jgi:radical SAM superfamily enzyme YgiQ (UPF0313 family)